MHHLAPPFEEEELLATSFFHRQHESSGRLTTRGVQSKHTLRPIMHPSVLPNFKRYRTTKVVTADAVTAVAAIADVATAAAATAVAMVAATADVIPRAAANPTRSRLTLANGSAFAIPTLGLKPNS